MKFKIFLTGLCLLSMGLTLRNINYSLDINEKIDNGISIDSVKTVNKNLIEQCRVCWDNNSANNQTNKAIIETQQKEINYLKYLIKTLTDERSRDTNKVNP